MPFLSRMFAKVAVAIQNNTDATTIAGVIGNKGDRDPETYETLAGYAHVSAEHVHSEGKVYPELAAPVTLTTAGTAWTDPGSFTEIVPASTITSKFDIHFVSGSAISATGNYVLQLFSGAPASEVLIASVDLVRTGNFSQEGSNPIQTPRIAANARISGKLYGSNNAANTVDFKVRYHTY